MSPVHEVNRGESAEKEVSVVYKDGDQKRGGHYKGFCQALNENKAC